MDLHKKSFQIFHFNVQQLLKLTSTTKIYKITNFIPKIHYNKHTTLTIKNSVNNTQ